MTEWIVKNIQDGECHYAQNYIHQVIEKNRIQESKNDEYLRLLFKTIKDKKESNFVSNRKCECPTCHPEVPRIVSWREKHCWKSTGKYMSSYRSMVDEKCKLENVDDYSFDAIPAIGELDSDEIYGYGYMPFIN